MRNLYVGVSLGQIAGIVNASNVWWSVPASAHVHMTM